MNVWFGRMAGYEWPTLDQWYFHSNVGNDPRISLWHYERGEITRIFGGHQVYFFLRNPYERFYSHIIAHQQYNELTFPEATRRALSPGGIKPAPMFNEVSSKILDALQPEFVDFDDISATLARFRETRNIDIDFETVYARQEYIHSELVLWPGAREVPMRELNAPAPNGSKKILPTYRMLYDEETARLVYSAYSIDFEKFSYNRNFRVRNSLCTRAFAPRKTSA